MMRNADRRALVISCGALMLCAFFSGCAQPGHLATDPFFEEWTERAREGDPKPVVKTAVQDVEAESKETPAEPASAEPVAVPEEEPRQLPTQIVKDLRVSGPTDVTVILRALARLAQQNMLIGQNVQGTLTFTLEDVPWDQAFTAVLATAGLTYKWEGDIIRVMTVTDMQRDVELEKLHQEQKTVQASLEKAEPLLIRNFKIKYTDAKSLSENLARLLTAAVPGGETYGSVDVNEENNTIIVHAMRRDMAKIVDLIDTLDTPSAQVRIDAHIVEANKETARDLGIQWGGGAERLQGERRYAVGGASVRDDVFAANFPADFGGELDGLTIGFVTEKLTGTDILTVQLTALEKAGRLNILSSPSIMTLDNQLATIESGEERAYKKTTGSGADRDVSIEWKPALLQLKVVPHVIDSETLRMEVTTLKEEFDESKPSVEGQYPKTTKRAETAIILHNGETVVIGGLSKELQRDSESGIPGLRSLPLLGYLFKSEGKRSVNDRLLIFITPRILGAVGAGEES